MRFDDCPFYALTIPCAFADDDEGYDFRDWDDEQLTYLFSQVQDEMGRRGLSNATDSTPTPTPAPTNEINTDTESTDSNWEIEYFVDEFNRPTKDGYITEKGSFEGVFSNSATNNSKLKGYFIIDNHKNIGIALFEYGNHRVKNASKNEELYSITFLDKDGKKNSSVAHLRGNGGDTLIVDGNEWSVDYNRLFDAFTKGGEITFRIDNYYGGADKYIFTEDFTGFEETYKELTDK